MFGSQQRSCLPPAAVSHEQVRQIIPAGSDKVLSACTHLSRAPPCSGPHKPCVMGAAHFPRPGTRWQLQAVRSRCLRSCWVHKASVAKLLLCGGQGQQDLCLSGVHFRSPCHDGRRCIRCAVCWAPCWSLGASGIGSVICNSVTHSNGSMNGTCEIVSMAILWPQPPASTARHAAEQYIGRSRATAGSWSTVCLLYWFTPGTASKDHHKAVHVL